jgi:hypothetical protein
VYEPTEALPAEVVAEQPEIPATNAARRHDVLALVILVLLATVAFGDVLVGTRDFYIRDLTRYYYPTKQILRDIVLHGEFPLWNRDFSAGQPIAANPEHEVFYPLTWLILLPSYDLGFRLHILIHIYIGLIGMYLLLRSMEIRPAASFYGALIWGLGGVYLSYINLLPILFCAAWLPLTCLFVRRFLLRRDKRDFALSALCLGVQFIVGEPTTIMQTGLLIGMYALYRAWYSRPRVTKSITRLIWIATISSIALLIGAAQVIPAIDHVHDSARSRPFGFDLVSTWSMPWAKFAELIYPNILGHLSVNQVTWYWGGGLYPGMGSPFLFSIYCGLLMMALVVGGAFAQPRGGRLVLLIVIASSVMALGSHTPLLKLFYDAGIATSIRYPEKFALMGMFAAIVFAAQMLDRMLAGDEKVREGALGFTLAVMAVAAILAVSTFTPYYARAMTKIWSLTPGAAGNFIIKLSTWDWWFALVRAAAVALLLITVRTRRRALWVVMAAVVVTADLLPIGEEINPRMPRRFFDPPPAAKMLSDNRADYRVFHEIDWYGQEAIAQKFFSTGAGVYWVVRNGLFPLTPAGAGIRTVMERDYDKTALLPTVDLADSVWDVKRSGREDWYVPFMAMSNAWYRVGYRDFGKEQKRIKGDFTKSIPINVMPAPHHPRYYFADQIVTIKDRNDFVKKLTEGSYSAAVAFVHQPSFVPARGVVRSARESSNTATLDVDAYGQSFLVMSVTPHKYWNITVDGRAVPAIVTNVGYQGIILPPGHHSVRMTYSNPLVKVGGAISLLTVLAMLVMAALPPRPSDPSHGLAAYEEPLHVVPDASGTHVEPAFDAEES